MVLSTVAKEGELDATKVEHSTWVSTMMNSFCTMVGFPIVKHESSMCGFILFIRTGVSWGS